MRKTTIGILAATAALAACQTVPAGYWHRDGVRVDANAQLLDAFQRDRAICDGRAAEAALTSRERDRITHSRNVNLVFDACLTERGYVRR